MLCYKCQKGVIMQGFSKGVCIKCTSIFKCSHTPSDKLCGNCKKVTEDICEHCGRPVILNCTHTKVEVIPTIATLYSGGNTFKLQCKVCGKLINKSILKEEVLNYANTHKVDLDTDYVMEKLLW